MSHCVIRNNTTDLIEKVITDTGENSILYNQIIDKLPNNIQYNQLSDYLKNQIGNGNIKDLSKEEVALAIWNKYTNQDIDGRDVDINDELDIKYIDINDDVNLNSNKPITNIKPGVQELFDSTPELANSVYEALGFEIPTTKLEGRKLEYDELDNPIITFFDVTKELTSNERKNLPSSILINKLLNGNFLPKINETDIVLGVTEGGIWRPNLKKIEASGNNKSTLSKKIAHELLHSVTANIIISYQNLRGDFDFTNKYALDQIKQGYIKPVKLNDTQIEALDNLVRLRNKVINYIKQNKESLIKKDRGFGNYDYFINTNYTDKDSDLHEFISEVFSNPELINILKEIPTEGKKSNLFKDFVDAIAKILGFNNTSILEDIIAYSEKAFFAQPQITPEQKQQALQLYSQYLDTKQPDVILPIGTSGSGKSTFIKSLPQENLVIIEPDAMRVEFTGDINDKSKDKEIYIEAANRAVQAIKQGKQVVFDTTNLTKEKRLPFIETIKKALPNANIQYKLMELNPELAKQRIKAQIARGENRANVPDSTIDRHAESYKQMLEDIKSEPITKYKELGGKQDIEGFKKFVGNKNTIFLKPNTDNKTSNTNTNLVNQNILSAQSSENPFKNILENILKTGKVGNMTDLDLFYAKLLLDNLNTFNPKLRIADLGGPLGNINIATQVITLDKNLINSGDYESVVQTVLHEVGHGFLVFPFSAVSGELNEADRMFKLTVSNLFANYKAKHRAANKKFGDDVENGFKDAEEFLSEFISSKTFRDYLYDLDRTLLQRMWDSIKTFFRYKVTRKESNDYKALDTIINSYILNGKTVNALRFKHHLKRTTFNKNRASTLQDVKANIIKEIDRLMIDLRDKSYGSSTLKKLNQLQDELLDVSEETAIDLYLERVDSIFSKTVAKFNAIEKDLHNIDNWELDEFNDLFYTMNMYKSYLKNFNMWDAGDEQSITEFLRANDMPIDPRIDLLAGKKRSIDFLYSRIAVKLVSRSLASKELLEELNANITDVNKKITYEQLEQSLKYLTNVQDINAPSLQAEAAINSKDLITALVANKIKSALNDAIEEDVNLESKLSLLYNKAFSRVESTVNSFKALFGKYVHEVEYLEHTDYDDSKNKVYTKVKKKAFITEIDFAKYQANKNALYASLEKLPELPKPDNEDYQILIRDYREIKARNNVKISLWSKQNEELHPDYQKIMDKKKEYLSAKEYDDWFKTNTDTLNGDFKLPESRKDKLIGQNENGDWIIAKKELVTPKKSMYTNPKWASLKDDKFYMALLAAYNEANMKLPKSKRLKYGVIPQRPKSWKEYTIEGRVPKNRLTGKGAKELEEKWGKNYTEVEEKEFWNAGLHTIDTKSYLPIYYTSSIDEDDVSMDLLQSVLKFASSSNKFSAFYKINPEISLMKDVVFGTNVIDRMEGRYTIKTDNKGNPTGEKINVTTRANEQLMSFLENSFYNTKLESPKAARIASNVTGFTSFVQLGGNLISSIPNAIYANFVVAQEAIFSKHFGGKGDLVKAHTIVSGSLLHDLAKFSGAVEHIDSKTAFLAKLFQAVQGNHQNEFGENASNKIINNLFSQNSFFILYSIPEYEIQTTTMVAMMLKTMVKTKSGESISLWDAYEQDETGRVALKPGVIFTKDQRNALIGKLHKANKELHGNYNKFDTPKLKRIWYGKFLFQFRNHIFEGFKRRFVKEYYDVETREYKKGYYRSGLDAGLNALTYGYLGLVKLMELAGVQMDKDKYKFAKLSAPDKMDSAKMLVDVATVVGLYFILVGLQAMAKAGDDDDELIYYAITTAKKVQTDISFYWLIDFDALIKQVRNPAVVMTFAENLLKGTELLVKAAYQDPNDPNQTSYYKINTKGNKKGDLKAKKHLYKAIPLLNQYERDVKEVAEWYLNPN